MPLSEESDPFGKQQKTALHRGDNSSRKGRDDRRTTRRRPGFFLFCPLCRAAYTAPPAAASARRKLPAPGSTPPPGLLHTMPALPACPMPAYSSPPRPTAPPAHCQPCSSQRRPPPCRACPMTPRPACFGADRWPDDPAHLPDRRRAGAARPAAPPLAMTPRPPPGAGPMTTARPPPRP